MVEDPVVNTLAGVRQIFHIFAAQEMMKGRPPTMPSGWVYDRALPYTTLVSITGNAIGLDQWTSRLPSVVFGVFTIIVVFVMGRA